MLELGSKNPFHDTRGGVLVRHPEDHRLGGLDLTSRPHQSVRDQPVPGRREGLGLADCGVTSAGRVFHVLVNTCYRRLYYSRPCGCARCFCNFAFHFPND